jgi:hypothetical protein
MQEEKQIDFDFNEILNQFRSGKRLTGKDGLLAPLIKQLTEAALEAEVEFTISICSIFISNKTIWCIFSF